MTDSLLTALEYHELGLAAIPVPSASKRATRSWRQWQDRAPKPSDLQAMFDNGPANIGVVCGRASNNLLVLDCENEQSFAENGARLEALDINTWTTQRAANGSPHDGGGHYWLRTPEAVRGKRVDPALELRGQGQYVLAPPSEHPGGGEYRFVNRPGEIYKLDSLDTLDWLELVPAAPIPKRSPKANKLLFGDQATINSYPSRSEAEYALCVSLANNGFEYTDVRALFRNFPGPGKFREMNAKDPANAERYLYHTWSKAKEWAIANPGEAILFARAAIEWATSRPWSGRTGATDRAVYLAHLSIVQKCGRQPYAASCRDLAELSGVSWDTASKATHRLRDGGLIELVQNATATFAHRYTLLATPTCTPNSHQPAPLPDTPPPKPCGGVSEEGASWGDSVPDAPIPTHSHTNLHLPLSLPQYTPVGEWQVKVQVAPVDTEHDTFRWYGLGKTGGEVLAALEAMEQGTVKEIIAATGRHRNTVQRKLKTMAELGMVERVSAYVWRFVGGDLDAAAEELGTSGVGERERQQHEQDRQDHRQSLEEGAKRVPAATAATGYRPGRVVVDTVTGEIL